MKKLLIVIAFLLFPILASASTIPDGAIIKTVDNPDVYIVKYNNGKQFRRLVLNPQVFESYGHLKWENLITVTAEVMNSYRISNLVKVENDPKVMALMPNGDIGSKSWLNVAAADFVAVGGDWDSVYQINAIDGANYIPATDLTTRAHVQTFLISNTLPGVITTPTPTIFPTPTPVAGTMVGGVISQNTTWTKEKSPYIVTANILVNNGVTLVVAPGVVIRFNTAA